MNPKKNKVMESNHFEEIHKRLCQGESPYSIAKWLKENFPKEDHISKSTLKRYKNNYVQMEDKVEEELNKRRQQNKKKNQKKVNKITKETAEEKAETIINTTNTENIVVIEQANVIEGLWSVAKDFPNIYEKAKEEVYDPDCNTTNKDVARLCLDAAKELNNYWKSNNTTIDINLGMESAADAIKRSLKELNKE